MAALPSRELLSPLREQWPDLCGCSYQIKDTVWAVVIFSTDRHDKIADIIPQVDGLLERLRLSQFVRCKEIAAEHYTFQLVDAPGAAPPIPTSLL